MLTSHSQRLAYTNLRRDVIRLISSPVVNVLDVGCSSGLLLGYIKSEMNAEYAVGIELNSELAAEATRFADRVLIGNLESFNWDELERNKYDLVVLADVLEHTIEPAAILREVLKSSTPNSQIIISLPNIQHWSAIKNLITGRWPQLERGLFDKTHLRFFTLASIRELASSAGLEIEIITRNYRLTDKPGTRSNRVAMFLAKGPLKPFLTYQYVIKLKHASS